MTSSSLRSIMRCLGVAPVLWIATLAGAQSFTVASAPSLTVFPGQGDVPLSVSVSSTGYAGPVNVTLSGLPSGIAVSPSPLVLSPGSTGNLVLHVGLNADQEGFYSTNDFDTKTVSVVGAVGSSTATSTFNLTVSLDNPNFAPAAGQITVPIVRINTTNQVAIQDKYVDVPGTITVTSPDGSSTYLPSSTPATFHLHGSSTLSMPKKPYHVKLGSGVDLLQLMGLQCPYVTNTNMKPVCDKSKSFILLANYDDKTLLRDWAASALANSIPFGGAYLDETPVPAPGVIPTPSGTTAHMPWAPHSIFVELYVNGAYLGNYQLIEQVKVDSHRINIPELTSAQTSGDLSGGYLLEIDQHRDDAFVFTTPQGMPMGLVNPDFSPAPEVQAQTDYISAYVSQAENALFSSNFTDPTQGWRGYFDEAAAINFYLVNDIMGNVDGGRLFSSTYLYKTVDNPFLYMGPIWDFDISSGNVNYAGVENPTTPWMQVQAPWYAQWFKDPTFKANVQKQFNTLKANGVLSNWVSSIATKAATLQQSQANNFARWPMLGIQVWPNPEAVGSYDGEVAYLTNYLSLRIAYLDSVLNPGKSDTSIAIDVPPGIQHLGDTVTLTAHVSASQPLKGLVSFFHGGVVLGMAPVDSSGTATFSTNLLRLGSHTLGAVYNGDSENALSSAPTTPLVVLPTLAGTVTSLTASSSNVRFGEPVDLQASVVTNSGSSAPTGTIDFLSNGSLVASVPVVPNATGGTASYSATSLGVGLDSLQAVYSGDTTYKQSSSNTSPVSVIPDFTISVSPSAMTIPAGHSAVYNVVFTPLGVQTGQLNVSCAGGPVRSTCTTASSVVNLHGQTVVTFTIDLLPPMNGNLGTSQVTFTGVMGQVSHSANVSLTVK